MINEPTQSEILKDFRFRCCEIILKGGDLEEIKTNVENGICPFLGMGFDQDEEMRRMRRYYRKVNKISSHNGLKTDFFKIIREVKNEL